CALCVTKTPQRGEKTRKLFPHNSMQNRRNNTFQRIHAITVISNTSLIKVSPSPSARPTGINH
ncbi:MAG: hypothetical protein LBD35_05180, partial [Prevotellaceae bacterium]|nr:hypothetical protein [Prevotellaceae bacterium]